MNFVASVTEWPFLQEPMYRWFIFLGALMAMMVAWHGVLSFMT